MDERELLSRLEQIQQSLERLTLRIDALEKQSELPVTQSIAEPELAPEQQSEEQQPTQPTFQSGPPPIVRQATASYHYIPIPKDSDTGETTSEPQKSQNFRLTPPNTSVPKSTSERSKASADDIEYQLGINGLLRGGVVVLLIGFLFLVALFIGRGMLTPAMQFAGELTFCAALVGIGFWKRDEKEDFGKLMIGLGSCGLYASFAGAHVYKHLISSELLVVFFMSLSLLNLLYAGSTRSKSFFTIGFLGGLVTALLPMTKQNHSVDLLLHFLILLPSAIVAAKNKWLELAALMWVLSTLALMPIATSNIEQSIRVGGIYLNTTVCLLTAGFAYKPTKFDPKNALQPTIIFTSGLIAIAIDAGNKGSLHSLVLCAIATVCGFAFQGNKAVRIQTWLGGALVLTLLGPIGLDSFRGGMIYLIETIVLLAAALGIRIQKTNEAKQSMAPFSFGLGCSSFAFGIAAFAMWFTRNSTTTQEFAFLIPIAINTGLWCAYYAKKDYPEKGSQNAEVAAVTTASVLSVIFIRSVQLLIPQSLAFASVQSAPLVAATLCVLVVSLVASKGVNGSKGLYIIASVCLISLLLATMGEPTSNSIQVTTLMSLTFLAAATLVLKIGMTKVWSDQFLMECRALTKIILCAIFIRLGVEVGSSHVLNLTRETGGFLFSALTLTWFTINLRSNKDQEDRWLGMFNCIGTGTYSVIFALSGGWISEHWIGPFLSLASLAFLATIYAYRTDKEKSDGVLEGILSVGIMAVSIPLFYRQLHKLFGLNEVASTTAAMTMTAILMIVCGFNFKERHLRYWALGLFSITLLKVVAIDLANLDSFIRVGILMLLGIAMIGGGYWYILWQKSNSQPIQEKTEPSEPTNSIE